MENAGHGGRRHVSPPGKSAVVYGERCHFACVGTVFGGKLRASSSVVIVRQARGPAPPGLASNSKTEPQSHCACARVWFFLFCFLNNLFLKKRACPRPDTEVLDVNKRLLSAGNLLWLRVRSGKSQARRRGIQPLRAPVGRQEGKKVQKTRVLVLPKSCFCPFKHVFPSA